jgi:very-short-patch-repair endonuclease
MFRFMPHRPISEDMLGRARDMRVRMTKAESVLWKLLRAHRLDGMAFRRQTPIGPYIADFVCHDAKLIVEADGAHHAEGDNIAADRRRDEFLRARGYKVMRFTNTEILEDRDQVVARIREFISSRASVTPPSHPSPARGEGFDGALR